MVTPSPDLRLDALFRYHTSRHSDRLALVVGSTRLTYRELDARIRAVAAELHRLGIGADDRVVIALPNCAEFVIAQYAVFTLGAVAVCVNPRLSNRELVYILADALPRAAFYHESLRAGFQHARDAGSAVREIVLGAATDGEITFAALESAATAALPEVPAAQRDALIMYTSGTTGQPKGALITHANMIVQNLHLQARVWGLGGDDRYLVITPLAHRAGCARLYNALGLGGTLVVMDKFEPELALRLIEEEGITMIGLVPTVIRMMLPLLRERPERCRSLRRIIVSTEAFPEPLKRELIALIPDAEVHSLFGSTEVLATNLNHAEQFTHPASVGRPLPGIETRLVDDAGAEVPPGEVGELLVRDGVPGTGATFRGYFNRPAQTASTIRDGWVHTGDLARSDGDGYLYIVDRKKDMVLSGGYNVYSKEVEQTLVAHPAIEDAAVIGVPDPLFGEAVAAYVQLRAGAALSFDEVIDHCREHLASYKKPRHVRFIESLPRTSTGKVLKNELRNLFAGGSRP